MATLAQLFEQGYQMGQNQAQQQRATTAAEAEYGARADNPDLYSKLQNQDVQYNQDQRAQAELPSKIAQNNATTGYYNANTAKVNQGVATDSGTTLPQMKLSAVNTMLAARDNGGDVGKAFDSTIGANPKAFGIDLGNVQAMRAEVIKDPTILDQIKSGLTDTPGMTTYVKPSTTSSKAAQTAAQQGGAVDALNSAIDQNLQLYKKLDEGGGMTDQRSGMFGAPARYLSTTIPGRFVGRLVGTNNSSLVQAIQSNNQQMIPFIKQALGLGAKMFDSNADRDAMLQALGNPNTQNYQAAVNALTTLRERLAAARNGQAVPTIKFNKDGTIGNGASTIKLPSGSDGSGLATSPADALPPGVTPDRAYSDAKAALAQHADPATIRQRLLDMSLDPAQVGL